MSIDVRHPGRGEVSHSGSGQVRSGQVRRCPLLSQITDTEVN